MENKEHIVREIAKKVSRKYKLTPPINFDSIFEDKNITYKEDNLGTNGDGYSDLHDTDLKVVINSEINYIPRKRFTIAHELGHIFIGWHNDVTLCKTDNEYVAHNMLDIQEKEANIFASELLMPTEWVKEQLKLINNNNLGYFISHLSNLANTSIMACLYALEHALDSGHVLIAFSPSIYWGKKFVARNTCEFYLKGMDFQETCNVLSKDCVEYNIGDYKIFHYMFAACPSKELILSTYNENKDLLITLKKLSNGSISELLHCLKSILNEIIDNYTVVAYRDNKQLIYIQSFDAELQISYHVEKYDLINICNHFSYPYKMETLNDGLVLFIIKEPFYQDTRDWRNNYTDSKTLFNIILKEVYSATDIEQKRMSISGVIGHANNIYKGTSIEELYNVIQKRMRRKEYEDFIKHERFNEFVSLKCYEIMKRKSKRLTTEYLEKRDRH